MAKIKDGGTIKQTEQRTANHVSQTKIKTTVEVSRNDRNNKLILSKKQLGTNVAKVARKTKAQLSWV